MKRVILFIFLFLLFSEGNNAQHKYVEYINLEPNFFVKYDLPVGIVIFPFSYQNLPTETDLKFYEALISSLGKQSKYIINYYKKLDALKDVWGIKDWDPSNRTLLNKLNSELDIKLVVYAFLDSYDGSEFVLKIINTTNYKEEYSQKYYSSSNSTSILDGVRLFTETKCAIYKEGLNTGTLSISTNPSGKFQVYLDDVYVGETPLLKRGLKTGKYKLTIKDNNGAYQQFEDNLLFYPINQLAVEKNINLNPYYGSIHLKVSPKDAIIELYNNKNNLIKSGGGEVFIDNLIVGDYKVKIHKVGYISESSTILISRGTKFQKEFSLITDSNNNYFINNIVSESKYVHALSLQRDGNNYRINFDLLGEQEEKFDIKLYLKDNKNDSFNRILFKLNGSYGNDVLAGPEKTIFWNFEKEISGGLDNKNLFLLLEVDKKGGGLPWYVWTGGVIAGGVAAYLKWGIKKDNPSTSIFTFPTPPIRPGN